MANQDDWGCAIFALCVLGGGVWAFNNYEIRKREQIAVVQAPSIAAPVRPKGMIEVTKTNDGSVWYLDADSVMGDRGRRQGWLTIDAQNDKSVKYRKALHLYLVDCTTTASRTLSWLHYDAEGNALLSQSKDAKDVEPEYFPPGSRAGRVVAALCHEGFDVPR